MLPLRKRLRGALACFALVQTASWVPRQSLSGSPVPSSISAKQWAADAAANEIEALTHEGSYLRYQIHQVDAKGDQVREVIESKDGTVARIVKRDNRPLTPEENAAEHQRLQTMLDSPAAFSRHVKNDQTGKRFAADGLRQMLSAMIFTYAPGQPQRLHAGRAEDEAPEIVVDFKPDPAWTPPRMTAEALSGFEGRLWIDPRTHYVTRLEGDIFRGVNFGFGIFGHIYPGGKVTFEQARVGEQRWIFTHFTQHLTLRVVMKTINQNSEIHGANFRPIPEMSYIEAIHLLLSLPLPTN